MKPRNLGRSDRILPGLLMPAINGSPQLDAIKGFRFAPLSRLGCGDVAPVSPLARSQGK